MSRVAKKTIVLPSGVDVNVDGNLVTVKGAKGTLHKTLHSAVQVTKGNSEIHVTPINDEKASWAQAGTARALINNLVIGVSQGFRHELELRGVGYRAKADGQKIVINLGYSHDICHVLPEGVKAETPSVTSIVLTGVDLEAITLEAARIREYRPPENYKGKGIRHVGEKVLIKETKKK